MAVVIGPYIRFVGVLRQNMEKYLVAGFECVDPKDSEAFVVCLSLVLTSCIGFFEALLFFISILKAGNMMDLIRISLDWDISRTGDFISNGILFLLCTGCSERCHAVQNK